MARSSRLKTCTGSAVGRDFRTGICCGERIVESEWHGESLRLWTVKEGQFYVGAEHSENSS